MNISCRDLANRFFYIGGPCSIEGRDSVMTHAGKISQITNKLGITFIFKSSYDKANRMSVSSYRGVGLEEGLKILDGVKNELGLPILTDVHCVNDVGAVSRVADIIQIPAFLCRQTDLLISSAKTGRIINIKKGQFLAPWDMKNICDKASATGNNSILLTERGTTFGYGYLVNDMRSIPMMKELGYPVLIDAGHSVQLPGTKGGTSGGMRWMIPTIARAGVAAGAHGLYLETHVDPDKAPSDGQNMLPIDKLERLLTTCLKIYEAIK